MISSQVTFVANLTGDPELRFTNSGTAVVAVNFAINERTRDASGEWKDGTPTYIRGTAWRQLAENIAETLRKGHRVIVSGRLRTDKWKDREGNERTALALNIDAIGPELAFATAKISRMSRNGSSAPNNDAWSSASRTRPTGNGDQPSSAPAGQDEEVPF
jgi:single-strand DNA-binding protein